MKTNVNFSMFCDAFYAANRTEQFSYAALGALFDYLEELESDLGEEIELDVIALCCEYAEYDSAWEAAREYGYDWVPNLYDYDDNERERSDEEMSEELEANALNWLQKRTTVIEFDTGVVIQQF